MWNPTPNWQPQGIGWSPLPIITSEVCDPPLICVSFNADWLPYLMGALQQLVQPSTWDTTDRATLDDMLFRATDFLAVFAMAGPCVAPPVVIPGVGTAQRACNIAGYLAHAVIREGLQKAIDAINADQTVLGYGVSIIQLIPGAGAIINFLILALQALYNAVSSGTLSDYRDAAADDSLWSRVTCAIYGAISADGQVTDSNFAAVVAAIGGVSYAHADVITAIHDYANNLGAQGLENLQQAGVLAQYDCSGCGGGVATGPPALPPLEASGRVDITITAGTAIGQQVVTFDTPFSSIPVITVSCNEQDFIASVDGGSTTGFTATIKSAVSLDSPITATVFWIAVQEGWL